MPSLKEYFNDYSKNILRFPRIVSVWCLSAIYLTLYSLITECFLHVSFKVSLLKFRHNTSCPISLGDNRNSPKFLHQNSAIYLLLLFILLFILTWKTLRRWKWRRKGERRKNNQLFFRMDYCNLFKSLLISHFIRHLIIFFVLTKTLQCYTPFLRCLWL